jgi:3-hydroxyacyl-CoA dehydrogenase
MSLVRFETDHDVALIVVDNPPVNALSPGVGEGIVAALRCAEADPAITAIVLIGAGRSFIAGADIRQFGKGVVRPPIGQRPSDIIDCAAKPVVAAIHGYALGGGLEYALACHYRIASAAAKVGLPEVLIGILPGGGGTQRLPRLIGAKAALDLIVSGRHVNAAEALQLGIIDAMVESDALLRAAAIDFARQVADHRPLPRVAERTAALEEARSDPDLFDAKRRAVARHARNQQAPYHCIAAVVASTTMPFDEGLHFERKLFETLENAPEARGLRYAFFAEREAAKLPDAAPGTAVPAIASVAIVGAGTMGAGIAMSCADAGLSVRLLDSNPQALASGIARIRQNYATTVSRGKLSVATMEQRIARIAPAADYEAIGDCDVAVEAVFEDLGVKQNVFATLDRAMKPGSLLLTNTSAFDIDDIAASTRRPQDVAGAHFFSPANVMRLLEVVRGKATSPATLAATMALGKKLGKINVVVRNAEGFLTSRSRAPFTTEMVVLLEEGALPEQIDRVMVEFGYPMGPFAVGDLAGLDIGYATRLRRAAHDPGYRTLPIADRLVEMGRLGQKTGAGWYRYAEGDRMPRADPAVAAVIAEFCADAGRTPRAISDEEILHRLLFGAVNECCRILEEGLVYRASDIDVAWVHGFGFPRYRGGLMFWADGIGAGTIYGQVQRWHRQHGERWAPAPLLRDTAEAGGSLRELKAPAA